MHNYIQIIVQKDVSFVGDRFVHAMKLDFQRLRDDVSTVATFNTMLVGLHCNQLKVYSGNDGGVLVVADKYYTTTTVGRVELK